MNEVELRQATGWGVACRLLAPGALLLWAVVAAGCATTDPVKPQAVATVAKPGNTYVVRRASVRTPAAARSQHQQGVVQRALLNQQRQVQLPHRNKIGTAAGRRPAPARKAPRPLTKAQYHARYRAQKRAEAKAAEVRRLVEQKALRARYVAKWKQQQQKREQYNKDWQRDQLAQQRRAVVIARKAQTEKERWARKQTAKKAAQTVAVRRPVAQKKVLARKSLARKPAVQKRPDPRQKYLIRWERMQAEKRLEAKKAEMRVERVIHNAKKQIGRQYVWGGASPKRGFDCSGLVQHSMRKGASVQVPRTAAEQYKAAVKVAPHHAERGDLIFFITRGKRVSHVGIYLGDNKFVHAPRTGRTVTTSRLTGYWKKRFVGFGRIPGACRLPV